MAGTEWEAGERGSGVDTGNQGAFTGGSGATTQATDSQERTRHADSKRGGRIPRSSPTGRTTRCDTDGGAGGVSPATGQACTCHHEGNRLAERSGWSVKPSHVPCGDRCAPALVTAANIVS